ncbi:MAG: hypothetical protein A2722_04030 [Candidatus Doudnabacteria bacterium RIFCSPHIGHO2_01_FULL_50_11]|uniref:Fibronectin type-III domain-containing protein n=1 Tax=Candidatus Doudnabacteria bacterium RIFCSPHIGHO2_01_FULL_50_11 TaxID=1817828 RepID=A0A1F5PMY6_9BACT|nr:MAG: hypothetical protein A2722_04030 [Candidatus Doudnabacteria bacterium RIFCSPHIGHO2_01_FULL_50_11]
MNQQAATIAHQKMSRWKKAVIFAVLVVFASAPINGLSQAFAIQKAQAFTLINPGIPIPGTEETTAGLDCGLILGILGECVPIKVDADPYRTRRNITKALLTTVLMTVSKSIAQWIAENIDTKLKINDYLGYFKTVSDALYAQRFIFDRFSVPEDRLLSNITYNDQYRGGTNFTRIAQDLTAKANAVRSLPLVPGRTTPYSANEPEWYAQLATAGSWLSQPADWNHVFNDVANQVRSSSQQAATMEILTSDGYKSSRGSQDLDNILSQKTIAYYTDNNNNKIPIMTPGGYAARALMAAIEKVLGTQAPYNDTNISFAIGADVLSGIITGLIFSPGRVSAGQRDRNDYTGATDASGSGPGGGTPCTVDTDGDGTLDGPPPCDEVGSGIGDGDDGDPNCTVDTDGDGVLDSPPPCIQVDTGVGGDDTNPPTTPTNLRVVSADSTSITLEWNASTDDVGIAQYNLMYVDTSTGISGVVSTISTTRMVTGLILGHEYSFVVEAEDTSGNTSPPSNIVIQSTQDTEPPSTPTSFSASYDATAGGVVISSGFSSDNVGVTGYRIYKDFVLIASNGSSFTTTDTSVASGEQHVYTGTAVDAAGNESDPASSGLITIP